MELNRMALKMDKQIYTIKRWKIGDFSFEFYGADNIVDAKVTISVQECYPRSEGLHNVFLNTNFNGVDVNFAIHRVSKKDIDVAKEKIIGLLSTIQQSEAIERWKYVFLANIKEKEKENKCQ